MNDRRDDGRPRAAQFAGGGKNFYADHVLRRDEAAPRLGGRRLAGEIHDAVIDHGLDDGGVRLKIRNGVCIFDDDDPHGRVGGKIKKRTGGADRKTLQPCRQKDKLNECVS